MTTPEPVALTDETLIEFYASGFQSGVLSILIGNGWPESAAGAQAWMARRILTTDPIQRDMVVRHARAILAGHPLPHEAINVDPETQARVVRELREL